MTRIYRDCGRTTTLRMIAELETLTSGSIKIGDREVSQLPASKRGIGVALKARRCIRRCL
jgi:ABC-type sugar transport system ATPase subunit